MMELKKAPDVRFEGLKVKKRITDGEELTSITTQLISNLYTDVKIHCATHGVKIQDFINEAVQDKLKTIKK
jgi:predicted DNA binding CopG/RHH family protein